MHAFVFMFKKLQLFKHGSYNFVAISVVTNVNGVLKKVVLRLEQDSEAPVSRQLSITPPCTLT